MPYFTYTQEHIDYLAPIYLKTSICNLAAKCFNDKFGLDKTPEQLRGALKSRGITSGRKVGDLSRGTSKLFSKEEVKFIHQKYGAMSRKELTNTINEKFNREITISQLVAFVKNHKINSGRTGHFKKGGKSWNANTAGKGVVKANSGSFKKGSIPVNRRPVGSERTNVYGYVEVKISECGMWESKQRVIWEEHNGSIPKGHNICFRDNDNLNFDPGNLFIVDNSEHMYLVHGDFSSAEPEVKDTLVLLARVNSKINKLTNIDAKTQN